MFAGDSARRQDSRCCLLILMLLFMMLFANIPPGPQKTRRVVHSRVPTRGAGAGGATTQVPAAGGVQRVPQQQGQVVGGVADDVLRLAGTEALVQGLVERVSARVTERVMNEHGDEWKARVAASLERGAGAGARESTPAAPKAEERDLLGLRRVMRGFARIDDALRTAKAAEEAEPTDRHGSNVWGHVAQVEEEWLAYFRVAASPMVKTVCEVGFNAGHSAMVWLTANPDAVLYSFDINERYYVKPMRALVARAFPNRFVFVGGDSTKTVPEWAAQHMDVFCDVVHVDGNHEGDYCLKDIQNFAALATPRTVLLVDDVAGFDGPKRAWRTLTESGFVDEVSCTVLPEKNNRSWCVGAYTPAALYDSERALKESEEDARLRGMEETLYEAERKNAEKERAIEARATKTADADADVDTDVDADADVDTDVDADVADADVDADVADADE